MTSCLQRPQLWGPIFNFWNIKLPLNIDPLSTTPTNFPGPGSLVWLYYFLKPNFCNTVLVLCGILMSMMMIEMFLFEICRMLQNWIQPSKRGSIQPLENPWLDPKAYQKNVYLGPMLWRKFSPSLGIPYLGV
jgi:hypothetical protein